MKNASILARHVLDSDHTMIIGDGATAFAEEMGMDLVEEESLVTGSF